MRPFTKMLTLASMGLLLAGCQMGGSPGVFEHTSVPPPPSLESGAKETPARRQASAPASRQRLQAPETAETTSAPSEPGMQPVMTGSGMGAGFRF
jgi:hypothetical protein